MGTTLEALTMQSQTPPLPDSPLSSAPAAARADETGTSGQQEAQGAALQMAFLDFQIEKAHAAMVQAGERIAANYIYTLLFVALTAAFCFGDLDAADRLKLPLIDLELSRWYAAGLALVLTNIFFYSLATMKSAERLLSLKLDDLIARRYGVEGYHWYLFFPSVFTSCENLGYVSAAGRVANWVPTLGALAVISSVPVLAFVVASRLGWSFAAIVIIGVAILVLGLTILTISATPGVSKDRSTVLQQIEN